jgi:hypothetical protein
MQATHRRTIRTHAATIRPSTQPRQAWDERIHRFILALLFTALTAALWLAIANRGLPLAADTLTRVSQPITQAMHFAQHPIQYQVVR